MPPVASVTTETGAASSSACSATPGRPELRWRCCGVRWPEVLASVRDPMIHVSADADPMVELGREYEETRRRMPSGAERTQAMEAIAARMRELAAGRTRWPLHEYSLSES